jgi:hypothetical protein
MGRRQEKHFVPSCLESSQAVCRLVLLVDLRLTKDKGSEKGKVLLVHLVTSSRKVSRDFVSQTTAMLLVVIA